MSGRYPGEPFPETSGGAPKGGVDKTPPLGYTAGKQQGRRSDEVDSHLVARHLESAAARAERSVLPSGSGLLAMETAYLAHELVVQVQILRRPSGSEGLTLQKELW